MKTITICLCATFFLSLSLSMSLSLPRPLFLFQFIYFYQFEVSNIDERNLKFINFYDPIYLIYFVQLAPQCDEVMVCSAFSDQKPLDLRNKTKYMYNDACFFKSWSSQKNMVKVLAFHFYELFISLINWSIWTSTKKHRSVSIITVNIGKLS